MTSLVSDFIINPVLRQARRFSRSSAATDPESPDEKSSAKSPLSRGSAFAEGSDQTIPTHSPSASTSPGSTTPPRRVSATSPTVDQIPAAEQTCERAASTEEESALLSSPSFDSAVVGEGHDGLDTTPPRTPVRNRSGSLPEDDGMGPMRKKILAVQSLEVPSEAKARLVHKLLTERYIHLQNCARTSAGTNSHHSEGLTSWEQEETLGTFDAFKFWQSTFGESSSPQKFVLTAEDVKPTYSSRRQSGEASDFTGELDFIERSLGCAHYQRNVKLQCAVCSRWYTCRLCHDAVEDHILPRKETKHMLCMFCGCAQKAAEACVNCGELAAHYFCSICKLWDSDRPTYHCNDCGICRRGLGLGKDYFHCKTCGVCKSIAVETVT